MEISGFRIGFAGTADRDISQYNFLAEAVGKEIANQGHRMVSGGCTGGTTAKCAKGVARFLKDSGKEDEVDHRIINFIPREKEFEEIEYGNSLISKNYDRVGRRPFMASFMDVLITINGGDGTKSEIEAALKVGTPVVPIWTTGGQSAEMWSEIKKQRDNLQMPYRIYNEAFISSRIKNFDQLTNFEEPDEYNPLAKEAVDIAIVMAQRKCGHCFDLAPTNNDVAFVIMPYEDKFDDVFSTIKEVFARNPRTGELRYQLPADLKCVRADEVKIGTIDLSLQKQIYEASFLIVDLTDNNPNVMYELGIGTGLGKKIISINQHMDAPATDVANMKQIPYSLSDLNTLTVNLIDAINQIYSKDYG